MDLTIFNKRIKSCLLNASHNLQTLMQYNSARTKQLKLPILLKIAYSQASLPENKQDLMMMGMKESEIDALLTLAENITNEKVFGYPTFNNTTSSRLLQLVTFLSMMN